MNKEQIINIGSEIEKVSEFSELCEKYEEWRAEVLRYVEDNNLSMEQYRIKLFAMNTPYESKDEKVEKYHACIKKTILYLQKEEERKKHNIDALETIVNNFGLYLQNMCYSSALRLHCNILCTEIVQFAQFRARTSRVLCDFRFASLTQNTSRYPMAELLQICFLKCRKIGQH